MEQSPKDFNIYSEEALDIVSSIEGLPFSYAFEKVMYDNRIVRTARYEAGEQTSFKLLRPVHHPLDGQIEDIFPASGRTIITGLKTELRDFKSDEGKSEKTINLSFDSGSMSYEISGILGQPLNCVRHNYTDTLPPIDMPADSYERLLSLFAYNFFEKSDASKRYETDGIIERMVNDSRFSKEEAIIIALGNYLGKSTLETVSTFDAPEDNDYFVATLYEEETPTASSLHNKLSIEKVSLDSKTLHQLHESYVEDEENSTDGNFIVIKSNGYEVSHVIDSKVNLKEYIKNCLDFHAIINDDLRINKGLDY